MIFRPARSLRRAKDAALTFHEPVALHHAHSGGAWTRRGDKPYAMGNPRGCRPNHRAMLELIVAPALLPGQLNRKEKPR
jgi:hypothetical protein